MTDYGICGEKDCGAHLIGASLEIKGTDYIGYYCPKCHHITPPPPGVWTPVGGGWLVPTADTLKDRTERRLSGNWVV